MDLFTRPKKKENKKIKNLRGGILLFLMCAFSPYNFHKSSKCSLAGHSESLSRYVHYHHSQSKRNHVDQRTIIIVSCIFVEKFIKSSRKILQTDVMI